MNDELLHRVWAVEIEILDEIHRICVENGLRYSLAYGTLLGAVRHHGFIPWDDDVDIMMPREDYNHFLKIWDQASKAGFILVSEESGSDYNNNFAKVKKDHTTFLQSEAQRNRKFHKGIFVDIFPLDRRAPKGIADKAQYFAFALNLLYNRGYPSGKGGAVGVGERTLLRLLPKKLHQKCSIAAGQFSRRWNYNHSFDLVAANTIQSCRHFYQPDIFERLTILPFEGKEYSAFQDYDEILRTEYGDYLKLPPEAERVWAHHPILIDFEHNYEDLQEEDNG